MIYIIAAVIITAADFAVKQFVLNNVALGETFGSLAGLVDFTYVQNTGAAFSILEGKMIFLSALSVLFCAAVAVYALKARPKHPLLKTALALMFSGALGNAVDRVFYGFVVDFIRVKFIDFLVFNIADMAITIGAALIVIYFIFFDADGKKQKKESEKKENVK
ncbi:MAG: signal peptidase II [Firmicutes bacterium]|nr:signal peptidase II [Bacillota bacterium]